MARIYHAESIFAAASVANGACNEAMRLCILIYVRDGITGNDSHSYQSVNIRRMAVLAEARDAMV